MKLLCVIARYWPIIGGSEMHTRKLMQAIGKYHRVHVCFFNNKNAQSNEEGICYQTNYHCIEDKITSLSITALPLLRMILKAVVPFYRRNRLCKFIFDVALYLNTLCKLFYHVKKTELVHIIYNGLTPAAVATYHLARLLNKPFVITPLLSFDQYGIHSQPGTLLTHIFKKANRLIALTHYEKNYLTSLNIAADKIDVIPVGPLTEHRSRPELLRKKFHMSDNPLVLFLGRHTLNKGFQLLLRAIPEVWRIHPSTHFLFFGPDSQKAIENANLSMHPQIHWLESQCQFTKSNALSACDLLCVPSSNEGLGAVYLEAWQFAKPVVALNIPVLQEVIEHNHSGLLVDQSPQQIAIAVQAIINNPILKQQLGHQGREKTNSIYSWHNISIRIIKTYQSLLSLRE